MLSKEEFKYLIEGPESTILDFKAEMYDFNDDVNDKTTSKYIKDIISFCNTIRTQTSYIIIGIKEGEDFTKEFLGISQTFDDSILQQKAASKIHPKPKFEYYTVSYDEKNFGVFEFPVTKYELPLTATARLKGISIGTSYFRQGTSNTEASTLDSIRINDWLKSLPEYDSNITMLDELNSLMRKLTSGKERLSSTISDIFSFAKKYAITTLIQFSNAELTGYFNLNSEEMKEEIKHRIYNVYFTRYTFELRAYSNWTASMLQSSFANNNNFFKNRVLFNQPLIRLEEWIANLENNPKTIIHQQFNSSDMFDDEPPGTMVTAFFFYNDIMSVYNSIRQKALDLLMKVEGK